MEHTQASNSRQFAIGSPIISVEAEFRSSNNIVNPNDVGLIIAHHFDDFRRQKRSHIASHNVTAAEGGSLSASPEPEIVHASAVPGFRDTHHCCRLCRTLLPATSFYPSNLKRSTFYCKTCCVAKSQASTHKSQSKESAAAPTANRHCRSSCISCKPASSVAWYRS